MREASLISELRTELRRRGVWGSRAERLIQEWTDHVCADAAQRVEKGADPGAAEEAAWQALGGADVLAASAARELGQASWLGRHPWLGGLMVPVLGWLVVVVVAIIPAALILETSFTRADHANAGGFAAAMVCSQYAFNWLPWLLSMAWLARIAVRMPGGWKLYWITAGALTIFSNSLQMGLNPPLHGPHSGMLAVAFPYGLLGAVANGLVNALNLWPAIDAWTDSWPQGPKGPGQAVAWVQTAMMLLGTITFYRRMVVTRGTAGTVVGS